MIKIPSLFKRDYEGTRLVYDEYVEGSREVATVGYPTIKWDGTAVRVRDGELYKRYDNKKQKKIRFWEPCIPEPDPNTGHWPGWLRISQDNPADKWFWEAWLLVEKKLGNGTYELCGPKIQRNPHKLEDPQFILHGRNALLKSEVGCTFESVKEFLTGLHIEGIVWHHPDGRMAKIKRRDFGIVWP